MNSRRSIWVLVRDWSAAVLGLLVLAVGIKFLAQPTHSNKHKLTLTAGQASGQRALIAEMLAEEARRNGLEARVQETAGSEVALDQVNAGKLDVALVQGGLGLGDRANIRQVGALHVEPLHLLVKAELFADVSKNLAALKGKVVNLSEAGSGTNTLALEVLHFAGLQPGTDFTPATLGYRALLAEPDRAKLPDATFMVQSLPSPVARYLVTRKNYRVVPLPFAEAFSLDALNRKAEPSRVEKSHIYDVVIPAFTYSVEPPVPAQTIHTLGTRLLVVAHKDVDASAIERLLQTLYNGPFAQVAKPPLDDKLLDLPPEFALHPGTAAHVQRTRPLIAADVVDYSEKVIAIAASVLGGLFFLWQALRQWHSRRQQRAFRQYLVAVSDVERRAARLEQAATLDLAQLLPLQQQLNDLKDQALGKFASGELQGEQMISGFLTLVNDARGYLTRLILHERENLEHQAEHQGRQVQEVWRENVNGPSQPVAAR